MILSKKPRFKPVYIQFIFNIKTTLHLRVVKLLLRKCYKIKLLAEFLQKGDFSCFVPPSDLMFSNLGYKLNPYASVRPFTPAREKTNF